MPLSKQSIATRLVIMAAWLAILLAGETVLHAANPAEYQQRVEAAKVNADKLFNAINNGTYKGQSLGEIVASLPPNERIDWPQGSVETDNRWLREQSDRFDAAQNDEDRSMVLTQIGERLRAISESVDQLKQAAEAETTKDQEKQKLAEILRREEYQKPQENDESFIEQWLNKFLEWLFGLLPRPAAPAGESSGLGSLQLGLQILLYAVVIGFIGFLLYKAAPFIFRRFERKERKEKKHRVILGERIEAEESASDLFGEAERLALSGDIRAAIRKGYIALLCDLSDRKVIRLAHHKTNCDYLRDLRGREGIFENVNGLTRDFERNWYGLRSADEDDWQAFRAHYQRTMAEVNSRI